MQQAYSLTLLPRAVKEFDESYLWYELQIDGLGEKFADSAKSKLNNISLYPELYGRKKGNFHEASVNKPFRYLIVYRIYKKKKEILVSSIFHTSRNPKMKYKTK